MNQQKLRCYQRLLCIARRVPTLMNMLPRGSYYLEDQLKRALASAILNLSEGNTRTSKKERSRFFDISLASISEVGAALDIISAYGYIPAVLESEIKTELNISYSMLMKLKKSDI